jgi:subtilisin family serine protease
MSRRGTVTGLPWRRRLRAAAILGAVAALALADLAAAEVGAALRSRMLETPGAHPLAVIVTLAPQVDPGRFTGRPAALIVAQRRLAERTQAPVIAAAGVPVRRLWITNALALSAPARIIERLAALQSVARVDVDPTIRAADLTGPVLSAPVPPAPTVRVQSISADPAVGAGDATPLDAIGARAVWSSFNITGAGVRLGSIDTGVDPANPDLAGKVAAWRDFVGGQPGPYDDNGHGTHTIGTMVGGSTQGAPIGVAPGAQVMVAKAMGADGGGLGSNLLAAAQWMADPDGNPATSDFPAAVTNSWTANDANDTWFDQVVRTWVALGIVPVFAAGNSGPAPSTVGSPGSYPSSIAVAAVDDTRAVASFSARGPVVWQDTDRTGPAAGTVLTKPDLAAPGVGIVSTVGTGYLSYSGTSMAAPHIAGVVALIRQASPGLGATDIGQLLRGTATDLGPPGPDTDTGVGLVNALAAVAAALGRPVPAPVVAAPPQPAPTPVAVAPNAPALQGVQLRQRTVRGRSTLVVQGRLRVASRLRALLSPIRGRVQATAGGSAASRSAPAGPFELQLALRGAGPRRYRLVLSATGPAGRTYGAPITRTVEVGR